MKKELIIYLEMMDGSCIQLACSAQKCSHPFSRDFTNCTTTCEHRCMKNPEKGNSLHRGRYMMHFFLPICKMHYLILHKKLPQEQ